MYDNVAYEFIVFGAVDDPKPDYEFIGLGDMEVNCRLQLKLAG